jgi:hypothetical protein
MHVRPGSLIAAATTAFFLGAACTSTPPSHRATTPPPPPSEMPQEAAPPIRVYHPPPPGATTADLVAQTDKTRELVAVGTLVFGLYSDHPNTVRVFRYEIRNHVVRSTRHPFDEQHLVASGGSLWLGGTEDRAGPDRSLLLRLDPRSLRVIGHVTVPGPIASLAGSKTQLWIGSNGHLFLFDPRAVRIVRSIDTRGVVDGIAIDAPRGVLWDWTGKRRFAEAIAIEERSVDTGSLIRRSSHDEVVRIDSAINSMVVTPGGLWLAYPTGNFGAIALLDPSSLRPIVTRHDAGTNALTVGLADGILWIAPGRGDAGRCADPATGDARSEIFRSPVARAIDGDVITSRGSVFAASGIGLVHIRIGARCRP